MTVSIRGSERLQHTIKTCNDSWCHYTTLYKNIMTVIIRGPGRLQANLPSLGIPCTCSRAPNPQAEYLPVLEIKKPVCARLPSVGIPCVCRRCRMRGIFPRERARVVMAAMMMTTAMMIYCTIIKIMIIIIIIIIIIILIISIIIIIINGGQAAVAVGAGEPLFGTKRRRYYYYYYY